MADVNHKWCEIVQNSIIKNYNHTNKLTSALRQRFSINYFTYHRINSDGKYTVLLDRPEWAEHYVQKQLYLQDPYLCNPRFYQSGLCLAGDHGSEEYKKIIFEDGKKVLQSDSAAILIKKNHRFVEFFGFCGNSSNGFLKKIYLNNQEIFYSFANFFQKESSNLLSKLEDTAASLIEIKGESYNTSEVTTLAIDRSSRLEFLRDMGVPVDTDALLKLTVREKECVKLLLENKSAKETAVLLNLSRRTVEHYFESIKDKFNCSFKHDVLSKAKVLAELGLL